MHQDKSKKVEYNHDLTRSLQKCWNLDDVRHSAEDQEGVSDWMDWAMEQVRKGANPNVAGKAFMYHLACEGEGGPQVFATLIQHGFVPDLKDMQGLLRSFQRSEGFITTTTKTDVGRLVPYVKAAFVNKEVSDVIFTAILLCEHAGTIIVALFDRPEISGKLNPRERFMQRYLLGYTVTAQLTLDARLQMINHVRAGVLNKAVFDLIFKQIPHCPHSRNFIVELFDRPELNAKFETDEYLKQREQLVDYVTKGYKNPKPDAFFQPALGQKQAVTTQDTTPPEAKHSTSTPG